MAELTGSITVLERSRSTNDDAMSAARKGAAHGACWIADEQLAGRGRREVGGQRRVWWSPAGVNLYMSVLLRPEIAPERASLVTLAAAVAAHEVLAARGVDCGIKWPNDLLVGGRKLAGILTEATMNQSGGVDAVVVGIGLNVNASAQDAPEELRERITTMRDATGGREFDRLALALALRAAIARRADQVAAEGFSGLVGVLRENDATLGRRVRTSAGAGVSRGVCVTGALDVELDGGRRVEVSVGEVVFEEV